MAKVTIATTAEERERIYQFRYQVYVEEMHKQPKDADHVQKILTDALDETATLLYITQENEIIATLRRNFLDSSTLPASLEQRFCIPQFASAFARSTFSLSSRLMVAPAWRNSATVGAIILEAYRDARLRGIQFDFLHAAAWLMPFYENIGYRRYTDHFFDPDMGLQIPQVLVLEDSQHLQAVRSPLYRIARRHVNCSAAGDWFQRIFRPSQPDGTAHLSSASKSVWYGKLRQSSPEVVSLFQGLSDESLRQLLQASAIHTAKSGETIVRMGDVANAMFLILSGVVAVSHLSGPTTQAELTLGACQTFGEANLFNQALSLEQAVALTDTELLILPKPAMQKLVKTIPEAMCRILINASHALCTRYIPDVNPALASSLDAASPQVA